MGFRFLDVNQGQKLQLWRGDSNDSSFPPLISSICSSSSAKVYADETATFPSWIAASFSTGYCLLFDMRSGEIIASWQAHDRYVTKVHSMMGCKSYLECSFMSNF